MRWHFRTSSRPIPPNITLLLLTCRQRSHLHFFLIFAVLYIIFLEALFIYSCFNPYFLMDRVGSSCWLAVISLEYRASNIGIPLRLTISVPLEHYCFLYNTQILSLKSCKVGGSISSLSYYFNNLKYFKIFCVSFKVLPLFPRRGIFSNTIFFNSYGTISLNQVQDTYNNIII